MSGHWSRLVTLYRASAVGKLKHWVWNFWFELRSCPPSCTQMQALYSAPQDPGVEWHPDVGGDSHLPRENWPTFRDVLFLNPGSSPWCQKEMFCIEYLWGRVVPLSRIGRLAGTSGLCSPPSTHTHTHTHTHTQPHTLHWLKSLFWHSWRRMAKRPPAAMNRVSPSYVHKK